MSSTGATLKTKKSKATRKKIDLSKHGILIALLSLILLFSLVSDAFLTPLNIFNVLRQVSIIGICAVGMTFVILTGGIDISVGSIIGVGSVTGAVLLRAGVNPIIAVIITLAVGTLIGGIIGVLINEFEIYPMIVTLGMMTILRGVAYLVTGGLPVYDIPKSFLVLGQGYLWIVPIPVIIMGFTFLIGYILLNKTIFGRTTYGTGGNIEASRLSGISVKKLLYKVYMLEGFLAALAGVVLLSRVNSGQPKAGTGYEMDIITACVLGGISMTGGEGKITGVIIGVLIMGVLTNGMILLNVNEYWQWVLKGGVLLIAVGFDKYSRKKKKKVA